MPEEGTRAPYTPRARVLAHQTPGPRVQTVDSRVVGGALVTAKPHQTTGGIPNRRRLHKAPDGDSVQHRPISAAQHVHVPTVRPCRPAAGPKGVGPSEGQG